LQLGTGDDVVGNLLAVEWLGLHSQPDDKVDTRQTGPPQPELLAHDALEPVAIDLPRQLLADDR
jgi:hypothetical protein